MFDVLKNTSIFHCYIVVHDEGEHGFMDGAKLIFKTNTIIGD